MPKSALSSESKCLPSAWTERIFTRLSGQLGAKMADLYAGVPSEAVKSEWGQALGGYSAEEIARGIDACQTRKFAPVLGEFLNLCRPALDPEVAWLEACNCSKQREAGEIGDWSHPAVYRAAREFSFELKSKSFKECRTAWAYALHKEFQIGFDGDVPKVPELRLEVDQSGKPPTPEQRAKLAEIMASFKRQMVEA